MVFNCLSSLRTVIIENLQIVLTYTGIYTNGKLVFYQTEKRNIVCPLHINYIIYIYLELILSSASESLSYFK